MFDDSDPTTTDGWGIWASNDAAQSWKDAWNWFDKAPGRALDAGVGAVTTVIDHAADDAQKVSSGWASALWPVAIGIVGVALLGLWL